MKIIYILIFFGLVDISGAKSDNINVFQCGKLDIKLNQLLIKKSEVQLNWGEGYSCKFTDSNDQLVMKIIYQYFPISDDALDDKTEAYISKFYAAEKNQYNLKMSSYSIGERTLECFNDNEEENGSLTKCFFYKDKKKINISFFGEYNLEKNPIPINAIKFN